MAIKFDPKEEVVVSIFTLAVTLPKGYEVMLGEKEQFTFDHDSI